MKKNMTRKIWARLLCGLTAASACLGCDSNGAKAEDWSSSPFEYREVYLPDGIGKRRHDLGLNSVDDDWGLWGHNIGLAVPEKESQTIYAKRGNKTREEQYCFSSNHLFTYLEKYIASNYGETKTTRFAILPNDNNTVCLCERCRAAGNTERNAAPAVFAMIRRLAERFPRHLFFASYYRTTKHLPEGELPANVGVVISAMDYPRTATAAPKEADFERLLTEWTQRTQHVYVWDYICNFDDYFTPFPIFDAMQRRLQLYARMGVKGIFMNGSGTDYSTMGGLKTLVLAHLMRDPELDWRTLLTEECRKRYPVTGDIVSHFMLVQESYAARIGRELPLYEGVAVARQTYLPEDEFVAFHDQLRALRPQTEDRERTSITKLSDAMTLTRLELLRLRGDVTGPDVQTLLGELECLEVQDDVHVYCESCWTVENYRKDYEFMRSHAEAMADKNLLRGVTLTPLTALDEEYQDISILTDGVLGLPHNYHCGQMLSSADPELRISVPLVEGMKHLRVCLTRNPAFHIDLPQKVILTTTSGQRLGEAVPKKSQKHAGHGSVVFELPDKVADGRVVLSLVRNPEVRTMALEEIEGF